MRRLACHILAEYLNAAGIRFDEATDQIEERALACSVRTNDRVERLCRHVQTYVVGCAKTAKGFRHVQDAQNGSGHCFLRSIPVTPFGRNVTMSRMTQPKNRAQYSVTPVSQV